MNCKIIDCKKLASELNKKIASRVIDLEVNYNLKPALAIIQVGNNQASSIYIENKINKCKELGIKSYFFHFPENIDEDTLIAKIESLNKNNDVHGIITQLPLPKSIETSKIVNSINPLKDVDGFHPENVGKMTLGYPSMYPCTPQACLLIIKSVTQNLVGRKVVVLGRSNIVGKPLALLLLKENCSVTILHSKSLNIDQECSNADILIAAVGQKHLVKSHWIKTGAIIIDVGINPEIIDNQRICFGDVDFEDVSSKSCFITPVPGGVGPLTISMLLKNTLIAACNQNNLIFDEQSLN